MSWLCLPAPSKKQSRQKIQARIARKPEGAELTGDSDARAGAKYLRIQPTGARTDIMHDYLKAQGLNPEEEDPKFNPLAAKGKVPAQATGFKGKSYSDVAEPAKPSQDQIDKDAAAVEEPNDEVQEYLIDPDYDLDQKGEELGEGAFGTVYMGIDGKSVIKEGEIGLNEMQALDLLKEIPSSPNSSTLSSLKPSSISLSVYNNPRGDYQ